MTMRSVGIFASSVIAAETLVIQNAQIGVEIDEAHGCSISGVWAAGDPAKTNLINTHDTGRYVQVSYYAGPDNFDQCTYIGKPWDWNPIGAGDRFGNPAKIISLTKTSGTSATCSMRPIQWACNNVLCDCTVDLQYHLEGNALRASVTLNNDRVDKGTYAPHGQELPAVYTTGQFYRLVGYTGSKPCTGDTLTEWDASWSGSQPVPGFINGVTEPFLAFLQKDGFGLGVWSSASRQYSAGFLGTKGAGGPKDNNAGYIAPTTAKAIGWNEKYTYEYALILGQVADIRSTACRLADESARVAGNSTATGRVEMV